MVMGLQEIFESVSSFFDEKKVQYAYESIVG